MCKHTLRIMSARTLAPYAQQISAGRALFTLSTFVSIYYSFQIFQSILQHILLLPNSVMELLHALCTSDVELVHELPLGSLYTCLQYSMTQIDLQRYTHTHTDTHKPKTKNRSPPHPPSSNTPDLPYIVRFRVILNFNMHKTYIRYIIIYSICHMNQNYSCLNGTKKISLLYTHTVPKTTKHLYISAQV